MFSLYYNAFLWGVRGEWGQSVHSLSRVDSLLPHEPQHGQAPRSITNSQSLLKLMSIESVMPSSHLILCRPLLLQPSIFPSIRVFSSGSALHIRWREREKAERERGRHC